MMNNENAYTTALISESSTLQKYIFTFLMSPNENDLSIFIIENPNFFEFNENLVQIMDPVIAMRTLSQFGFKRSCINTMRNIWQVTSVNEWLQNHLDNAFQDLHAKTIIRQNQKLLNYLGCIVNCINQSNVFQFTFPNDREVSYAEPYCPCR